MNEWLTVITSSPGPTPTASRARCSAVVQLETAQACGAPTAAANSRSNAADFRTLRHPSRQDRAAGRFGVALVEPGPSDGNDRGRVCSHGVGGRHPVVDDLLLEQLLRRLCADRGTSAAAAAARRTATPAARIRAASRPWRRRRTSRVTSPGRGSIVLDRRIGPPGFNRGTSPARSLIVTSLPLPMLIVSPDGSRMLTGQQDAARGVAHVGEVAGLRAVAEHDHRPAGQAAQEELGNHLAAVALVVRARTVGVERAHDDGRIPVGAEVGARVALAGQLRPAVDRAGKGRVILVMRPPDRRGTARRRRPPSSRRRRTAARPPAARPPAVAASPWR